MTLIEFLMNRTDPSHMPTLTPPGCLLRGLLTMPRPTYVPVLSGPPVAPAHGGLPKPWMQ